MSDNAENAATRLWRDRAQLREQERNEAQVRARIAEEKVAILTAENERLATEISRLRGQATPDAAKARAETEQQIEALRTELLALLACFLFGLTLVIVRRAAGTTGFVVQPRRWVVERSLGWLGRWRRLSKDDEELPEGHRQLEAGLGGEGRDE